MPGDSQIGQPATALDEVVSHEDGRTVGDTIADPKEAAKADSRLLARSAAEMTSAANSSSSFSNKPSSDR